MAFDRLVEQKIREAIEHGQFDNLEGKGKPIKHDAYFSVPGDMRLCFAVLKNSGFIPEEVELLKEIESLDERRAASLDEDVRGRLGTAILGVRLKLDLLLEQRKRRRPARRSI